jgi:hypothetical protein
MTPNLFTNKEREIVPQTDEEALLYSEIEFWQEVIATCPVTQSSECIERMHQALVFAESRLEKLQAGFQATDSPAPAITQHQSTPSPKLTSQAILKFINCNSRFIHGLVLS